MRQNDPDSQTLTSMREIAFGNESYFKTKEILERADRLRNDDSLLAAAEEKRKRKAARRKPQ